MASSVTPLAAALIGAGGAVFGGALTTSGQLLIERARGKREVMAEKRRHAREVRLAVRLVAEELAESMSLIEGASRTGRYWVGPRELPTSTWSAYQTTIAATIESPTAWRSITAAYDAINNLNWTVQHRRFTDQLIDTATLGAFVRPEEGTREVWRTIRGAIGELEQTIGVMGPASRIIGQTSELERGLWPHGDGDDFDSEAAQEAHEEDERQRQLREMDDY
jgi:hypothetical protein